MHLGGPPPWGPTPATDSLIGLVVPVGVSWHASRARARTARRANRLKVCWDITPPALGAGSADLTPRALSARVTRLEGPLAKVWPRTHLRRGHLSPIHSTARPSWRGSFLQGWACPGRSEGSSSRR